MNKFFLTLMIIANVLASSAVYAVGGSPEGYWISRSPFFGSKPIGIVKISIIQGELVGELIKILPLNGTTDGAYSKYRKFSSSGPVMMFNYRLQAGGKWTHGKIFDPVSALLYDSDVWLDASGKHLYAKGKFGVSSQTAVWDRVR